MLRLYKVDFMFLKFLYILLLIVFIGGAGQMMFHGIQNFQQHDPLNGFLNFLLIPVFLFIALVILMGYENEFNVTIFPNKKRKPIQEMTQEEFDRAIRRLDRNEKIKNIISFITLCFIIFVYLNWILYELF